MQFDNVYEDARRAESYAKLEFPGTYYLAYRDLPQIIAEHVNGNRALDFGCGTGRSTRFLRKLGFDAIGIDISRGMIAKARGLDPLGDYRVVAKGDLSVLENQSFDLVQSVFSFDNIPTAEQKLQNFTEIGRLLKADGKLINLVSSPEIYVNEWASFTTKDFPENRLAKSGDIVRIIMTDVEDRRPVEDVLWTGESYIDIYRRAGLTLIQTRKPLGLESEPYKWVNEMRIAPWTIYVLKK